jgi:glycosyltransferase involved in cell wall biosynthesis
MHVAMVDPSLFTIPYDCSLIEALRDLGQQVTLYGRPLRQGEALTRPIPMVRQFYMASERLPKAIRKPLKGIEHAVDMAHFVTRMRSAAARLTIHFQWCPLPVVDMRIIAALRKFAPVVLTVHDPTPYNGHDHGLMTRGSVALPTLFDAVIVHSEAGCAKVRSDGADPRKIHIIPHGALQMPGIGERKKINLELAADSFKIVFFGKIKPYKGLETLIGALDALPIGLKKRVHLIVVGEPMMGVAVLQEAAQKANIKTTWELRFITEEEVDSWLGLSDIFIFPYRDIDASGVFMSCLKFGKPIIASKIGAFSEVLQDGVHGYLIETGHLPRAWTSAINLLMTNPDLVSQMGTQVTRLAEILPGWPDIARATIETYEVARQRWAK